MSNLCRRRTQLNSHHRVENVTGRDRCPRIISYLDPSACPLSFQSDFHKSGAYRNSLNRETMHGRKVKMNTSRTGICRQRSARLRASKRIPSPGGCGLGRGDFSQMWSLSSVPDNLQRAFPRYVLAGARTNAQDWRSHTAAVVIAIQGRLKQRLCLCTCWSLAARCRRQSAIGRFFHPLRSLARLLSSKQQADGEAGYLLLAPQALHIRPIDSWPYPVR